MIPAPKYAPYAQGEYRMAMGLMALDLADWIEPDRHYAEHLLEKRRLLAEHHDEVFQARPGSEAGQREVLLTLLMHMAEHFPDLIDCDGKQVKIAATGETYQIADFDEAPLELAGRLVQEDLCLMEDVGEDGYQLTAASLCFPTRWKLADKIGRPMLAIHDPVPGYAEKLGRPVGRFLGHLHPDRPVMRLNWSILDDAALFQPGGHYKEGGGEHVTSDNAGEKLFIRVERQTLRRMPETGAVLFGIKILVDPLASLEGRPDLAQGLAASIREIPDEMRHYKSVTRFSDAILGWLERVAPA